MAYGMFGINSADLVWQLASDRQWHTLKEAARLTQSTDEKVALIVNFLEKYGFIQSYFTDEKRFRITLAAASPIEIAYTLQSLL
jgi:hypothetical protein